MKGVDFFRLIGRVGLIQLLLIFILQTAFADSATWSLNPTNGDWNTAANWMPPTIPNGSGDIATFDVSNTTDISVSTGTEVNGVVFNSGASEFLITANPGQTLTLSGSGITNNSGIVQNLIAAGDLGVISFSNSGTAGDQTLFTTGGSIANQRGGGRVRFFDDSSADHGVFINQGSPLTLAWLPVSPNSMPGQLPATARSRTSRVACPAARPYSCSRRTRATAPSITRAVRQAEAAV